MVIPTIVPANLPSSKPALLMLVFEHFLANNFKEIFAKVYKPVAEETRGVYAKSSGSDDDDDNHDDDDDDNDVSNEAVTDEGKKAGGGEMDLDLNELEATIQYSISTASICAIILDHIECDLEMPIGAEGRLSRMFEVYYDILLLWRVICMI
jgi:hypothetical protein